MLTIQAQKRVASGSWPYLVAAGIAMIAGCEPQSRRLSIQIPNDYQGVFMLLDDESGKDDKATGSSKLTVIVPTDGIAHIKNGHFLYEWHTTTVHYSDSSPIPFCTSDDVDTTLGCWSLYSTPQASYYFVGHSKDRGPVAKELDKSVLHKKYWLRPVQP
jgi:hypothetical protein